MHNNNDTHRDILQSISLPSAVSLALGAVALAGAPLTAWQFIDAEIERQVQFARGLAAGELQREINLTLAELDDLSEKVELLRDYSVNLCRGVRKASDPPFNCGSTYYRQSVTSYNFRD